MMIHALTGTVPIVFPQQSRRGNAPMAPSSRPVSNDAHESLLTQPNNVQIHMNDDKELLHAIAKDDDVALHTLYQRYGGLVYSLAYRMIRDQSRAEEVVQETFIRVWRTANTFDVERGRVEAWVVTIARNVTISLLRKEPAKPTEDYSAEVNALVDEQAGPEDAAWINDRRQIVREALHEIPEAQRRVVIMAYFDGLTQAEIAEKLCEPIGTIKSRLRLALKRLEQLLKVRLADEYSVNQE